MAALNLSISRLVLLGFGAAFAASGFSQDQNLVKSVCTVVGSNPVEMAGEGRGTQVTNYTCKVEGGPLDGGEMTGTQIYGFQGTNGVIIVGGGVVRKPGNAVVFQTTEGTIAVTMADGKPTGFASSGKGVYKEAIGAAVAPYKGKTYSYSARPTGQNQFVIESKND